VRRAATRWIIATGLIAVPLVGLVVVLIVAGLGTAAELATLIALAPVAAGIVSWARFGTPSVRQVPKHSFTATDDHNGSLGMPPESELSVARSSARAGNSLSLPKVTFREPIPWSAFLWFGFFACYVVGGVALAIVGFADGSGIFFRLIFPDILFAMFGVGCIVAMIIGGFGDAKRELFDPRSKLVIDAFGIRYSWSLTRRIRCSWRNITVVRTGSSDGRRGSTHMVVTIGTSAASSRDIVLCALGYVFPRDRIRAAVASFEPSLLDPDF